MRAVIAAAVLLANLSGWNLTHLSRYDSPNFELVDIEIDGDYAFVPGGSGGIEYH